MKNCTELVILELGNNNFSGSLPLWIGDGLHQLSVLNMRSNAFTGKLPSNLCNLQMLHVLDLSGNRLSGSIPGCVGNFTFMNVNQDHYILSLYYLGNVNQGYASIRWKGILEQESGVVLRQLFVIDLSNNRLTGRIPRGFTTLTHLESLDLSSNDLNNNFSSFSASTSRLNFSWVINLSNNQLSGPLPGWIFCLQGLLTLNVENNMLNGDIPSSIASSWGLNALHMNNNRLSGELPSSMKNCTELVILELGNNNFSGSLPLWIGDSLHLLSVLNMRSNAFTGELPSNLCNLQMLHVLDLSGNRLSGSIPGCVDNFTIMNVNQDHHILSSNLYYLDIMDQGYASIMWKGILEHESDFVLPQVFVIDLSSNRLTGRIPSGFTTLTHLESLDLSSNDLNGSIPDKIGQLKNLEVLKLSSNRLGGEIPQSLADLTFLNTLNLSSNNFSGEIPKSTQLQSLDPSSYGGNPDLCGEPLPTLCPWDKPSVGDHAEEEESHESFDFEAFYASLGAGFASGLFGILGILHFHAPSRHGFFRMASEVGDWIFVWTMLYKYRIKRRLCFSKEKEAANL